MEKYSHQDAIDALHRFQVALLRIRKSKMTLGQRNSLQKILHSLNSRAKDLDEEISLGPNLVKFNEAELSFIEAQKSKKIPSDIIRALEDAMEQVILNPKDGVRFIYRNFSASFARDIPDFSGKVAVFKVEIRRVYRLIYGFGGSLQRPYFIDFDHRKDIYKHRGHGT